MGKVLVIGASSFVGRYLYKRLGPKRAIGTYHSRPFPGGLCFDLRGKWDNEALFDEGGITGGHAVIAGFETDLNKRDNMEPMADGIIGLLPKLWRHQITPIFLSSEYVFEGYRGGYTEEDLPKPSLEYGRQKLRIEKYLKAKRHPYLTLRLSKVYGNDLIEGHWLTNMIEGYDKTLLYAVDQAFSPVFVHDVVNVIIKAIDRNLQGLYHVCGDHRHTRFEVAGLIGRYFGLPSRPISSMMINDFPLVERWPSDVSMRNDLIKQELDVGFGRIEPVIHKLVKQHEAGLGVRAT